MSATWIAVGLAAAVGCDSGPPVDVRFSITGTCSTSQQTPIRSVQIKLIRVGDESNCFEDTECVRMPPSPVIRSTAEVQQALPANLEFREVLANRRYQVEAVGYSSNDCTTSYVFCGRSEAVNFKETGNTPVKVTVSCSDVSTCAVLNVSLRYCP